MDMVVEDLEADEATSIEDNEDARPLVVVVDKLDINVDISNGVTDFCVDGSKDAGNFPSLPAVSGSGSESVSSNKVAADCSVVGVLLDDLEVVIGDM